MFGIFTGVTLWWSFITGYVLDKLMMSAVFILLFIGVNLTFFPLHFAGLHGFPRKYLDYPDVYSVWNIIASYGSIIRTAGLFLFIYVLLESFFSYRLVIRDYYSNRSPEYCIRNYVFGHSYQAEIYFSTTSLKN